VSYSVYKIYAFECDIPGCIDGGQEVFPEAGAGLRGALKELTSDVHGWAVVRLDDSSRFFVCPKHPHHPAHRRQRQSAAQVGHSLTPAATTTPDSAAP
jgi:hypothetical protein